MNPKITPEFLAALTEGADLLDRLNKQFPNLASDFTIEAVVEFRRRPLELEQHHSKPDRIRIKTTLNDPEPEEDTPVDKDRLATAARELLAIHGFEETLDILAREHGAMLTMVQLTDLAGKDSYIAALRREAHEFQANAISVEQIAQLWKDFGRPPLGDAAWTARGVSQLME